MKYEWIFPSTGGGQETALNDVGVAFFRKTNSLARETLQNVMDARDPTLDESEPVVACFEKMMLPTESIPGIEELRATFAACRDYCLCSARTDEEREEKGKPFFDSAESLLKEKEVPVLRISDYNTVGLTGGEEDENGNWSRLIKRQGDPSKSGAGGGSYGIGQKAPYAYSRLRTVFYSTRTKDGSVGFIGKSTISGHRVNGDARQPIGFWGERRDAEKMVRALRSVEQIGALHPAFSRKEVGTDLFITGYDQLVEGSWKDGIITSVLCNFFAAIHEGHLKVQVRDSDGCIDVNRRTLHSLFEDYSQEEKSRKCKESFFYYKAMAEEGPDIRSFEEDVPGMGKLRLFIRKEKAAPSKVVYMRKPKIVVYDRTNSKLRDRVAVFIADGEEANSKLRALEDPAHEKWDASYKPYGRAVKGKVSKFVNEKIKEVLDLDPNEVQDIEGLDRYLPAEEDIEESAFQSKDSLERTPARSHTDIAEEETGSQSSKTESSKTSIRVSSSKKPSQMSTLGAVSEEERQGNRDSRRLDEEGDGERWGGSSGLTPGAESEGQEGSGREEGGTIPVISNRSVFFRSFADERSGEGVYRVVLHPRMDCRGALRLRAEGEDGKQYPVRISKAVDLDSGQVLDFEDSALVNLELKSGQAMRAQVSLNESQRVSLAIGK